MYVVTVDGPPLFMPCLLVDSLFSDCDDIQSRTVTVSNNVRILVQL
jgi:hypothetical protein